MCKETKELTKCPECERLMPDVKERRRNTAYTKDEINYHITCLECHQQDWDYYQERWDDYNADIASGLGNYGRGTQYL